MTSPSYFPVVLKVKSVWVFDTTGAATAAVVNTSPPRALRPQLYYYMSCQWLRELTTRTQDHVMSLCTCMQMFYDTIVIQAGEIRFCVTAICI